MLTEKQQRQAAKQFAETWAHRGAEKQETQPFWISLLRDVFGIEKPEEYIKFEVPVLLDHTSFIDGHIPSVKVLIEQKSIDLDLNTPAKQSDGQFLTPFEQAKRYGDWLSVSEHPRWIVTCNFKTFQIYDMEHPHEDPEVVELKDLPQEFYRLQFLVDGKDAHIKKELEISVKAGDIVGLLYDALLKQYKDPSNPSSLRSLNILCVRLVFCLYAEDAGLFGKRSAFHDYLAQTDAQHLRTTLIDLFRVLDTPEDKRDPYLTADLAAFPYVNGGLFAEEDIEIPNFTEEIRELLLTKASADFNWADISPTIFGAVFESTLNPETRRKGGMHYTSVENIHKVIDPLFLANLRNELKNILTGKQAATRNKKLQEYQNKLSSLTFLDPACGSGNFLTETYLSLRRLENTALRHLQQGHRFMGSIYNPVKVSIGQFYGIEINDFAVSVAKTALWIAEAQMLKETEDIVGMDLDFFPLKSYANIVEGNALRMDWNSVISKDKLNYIMGNPPFIGAMWSKGSQREDIANVFPECDKPGQVDYVAGWYIKAAKFIQNTNIRCALVSTNSICQGQQVFLVWKPMLIDLNVKIDFACTTFRWDSEANIKAHVHCVIIGFSCLQTQTSKYIFTENAIKEVSQINGYLTEGTTIFIESRKEQISGKPLMHMGVMARDGGYLILNEEEYQQYIVEEPQGEKFLRRYMMGREFINNIPRYCFWLVGVNPAELRTFPLLLKRIESVREERLKSPAKETQLLADTPTLFAQLAQPKEKFIAFPKVSSERRKYIPIGFLDKNIIVGDKIYVVENVGMYHFGVLTSNVHNAWMRTVAGRLKSDYSYSNTIVYNNFPWPTPSEEQKQKIEKTAQAILDARALYPNSSLADLYDDLTMPVELRKAHQENDKAVLEAYGIPKNTTESAIVAHLFKLYQQLAANSQ